jgi:hypothetical protein
MPTRSADGMHKFELTACHWQTVVNSLTSIAKVEAGGSQMGYMFLLSVLAGVLAFGAFILICWAYILLIQLKIDRAGWKILIGVLSVVLLAVP